MNAGNNGNGTNKPKRDPNPWLFEDNKTNWEAGGFILGLWTVAIFFILLLLIWAKIIPQLDLGSTILVTLALGLLSLVWWMETVNPGEAIIPRKWATETADSCKSGHWIFPFKGIWWGVIRRSTKTKELMVKNLDFVTLDGTTVTLESATLRYAEKGTYGILYVEQKDIDRGAISNVVSYLRQRINGKMTEKELRNIGDISTAELATVPDFQELSEEWDLIFLRIELGDLIFSEEYKKSMNQKNAKQAEVEAINVEVGKLADIDIEQANKFVAASKADCAGTDRKPMTFDEALDKARRDRLSQTGKAKQVIIDDVSGSSKDFTKGAGINQS